MSWLNYNPVVHWPLSGSVTQDIHPSLLIKARDAETEVRVLREVASYGRQLGKLSELLLALIDSSPELKAKLAKTELFQEVQLMVENIERVKLEQKPLPDSVEGARALVADLKKRYRDL